MGMMTDSRIAGPIATLTTTTGVAEWLNWIPNDIGKLATLVGILLSLVLIGTHLTRAVLDYRRHRAKMDAIRTHHDDREGE